MNDDRNEPSKMQKFMTSKFFYVVKSNERMMRIKVRLTDAACKNLFFENMPQYDSREHQ